MPPSTSTGGWLSGKRRSALFFLGFVIVLSYLTYFHRYWQPQAVFWDENYHIASAQKYIHGVYFMEQHPPLGKLLIAAGETLLSPNEKTDQFLGTDYGTDFGQGFSFAGYRFFSALLSWWAAALLFIIFLMITREALYACLLTFFYIFDNALIVHSRGAMLEGPLQFFVLLTILAFFLALRWKDRGRLFWVASALFGVSFALTVTTKVLGLILLLLIPSLFVLLYPRWKKMLVFLAWMVPCFLFVYCSVWYVHFARGNTINPALPDNGYYQASEGYKQILFYRTNKSLAGFPVMLRDSLKYVGHYNRGAPRLDLCKVDENGSHPLLWPVGARSINYRWETPSGQEYKYLYLQANPAVWWIAFLGVFLGAAFAAASFLLPLERPLRHRMLLLIFLGLYISFMIAVSRIDRVLYLYHYFIPLLFSFIILGIVFDEIRVIGQRVLSENARMFTLLTIAALVFGAHEFYRPLTYYEPLTNAQVERRAFFRWWELHCVNCPKVSPLVVPSRQPGQ
jgi:dolichyl-phosphate-mannose--protein O-mannosyl transferase